jgi:hypothetical protein
MTGGDLIIDLAALFGRHVQQKRSPAGLDPRRAKEEYDAMNKSSALRRESARSTVIMQEERRRQKSLSRGLPKLWDRSDNS